MYNVRMKRLYCRFQFLKSITNYVRYALTLANLLCLVLFYTIEYINERCDKNQWFGFKYFIYWFSYDC